MNDNNETSAFSSGFWPLVRAGNIAANGRWFILALVAISIAAGDLRAAVLFAAVLGFAVIIEQLPARARQAGIYGIYVSAAGMAVRLLISLW